jgi:hypothetical protein
MALVGKILPRDVNVEGGVKLTLEQLVAGSK